MSLYVLYKGFHRQLPEADMKLGVKRNVLYITREERRKQTVLYVREHLTLNDWYEQQDQFKLAGVEPIWILGASRYVRYSKLREARGARLRGSVPKAIFQETITRRAEKGALSSIHRLKHASLHLNGITFPYGMNMIFIFPFGRSAT